MGRHSKQPPKVLLAILSTFERHGWLHPSIAEFLHALRFNMDYATNLVMLKNFSPAASARNVVCKAFKDSEPDWLCMIDNDMEIPLNLLDTLKDVPDDAGIVVPTFYLWDQSKPSVTLCWGMDDGKSHKQNGKEFFRMAPGFHELTKCGTGVMFIRRTALQKIPYPYFQYKYNEDGGMVGTEDITFCEQARKAGVKIYGNADIRVGHYHQVNLLVLADMIYNGIGLEDNKAIAQSLDKIEGSGKLVLEAAG